MIPHLSLAARATSNGRRGPPPSADQAASALIALDTRSPASEAYRSVRNRIAFADPERAPRLLVVTSATREDGKSTTAANLAVSLTQQGLRTLLVDADLRGGALHELLNTRGEPGFVEVVLGRATVDEAVRHIPFGDLGVPLHFLPTGKLPSTPGELVGLPATRRVLEEFRELFEAVVLNAPPLASSTDAALLGRLADATVLVTRLGATERDALEHAAAQLHQFGIPVGGIVLNELRTSDKDHSWFRMARAN
jgi:capsular exopolysaccharide synthesis family protein